VLRAIVRSSEPVAASLLANTADVSITGLFARTANLAHLTAMDGENAKGLSGTILAMCIAARAHAVQACSHGYERVPHGNVLSGIFSWLFNQLSNFVQLFVRFWRRMHVVLDAVRVVLTVSFGARAAGVCSQRVLGEAPKSERIPAHGASAHAA
jgi:hypothetical protein